MPCELSGHAAHQKLCFRSTLTLRTRLWRVYTMSPNSKSRGTGAKGQAWPPLVLHAVLARESCHRARKVARALQVAHPPLHHLFADSEQAVVHVLEDTQLRELHLSRIEPSRGLDLRPIAVRSPLVVQKAVCKRQCREHDKLR
jgi:hypothetical protein